MWTSNGEQHPVRILIDQRLELSFITEDLVRRTLLYHSAASIPLFEIGGTFRSHKGKAFVLSRFTTKLPPFNVSSPSWPYISGFQLDDPDYSFTGPIHIIIGSDNYHAPNFCGRCISLTQAYHCSPDLKMQNLLTRFWMQKELPNTTKFISPLKPSALGESKSKALGCLRRLFLQFSKSMFQQFYVDFIDEYKHLGHMMKVNVLKPSPTHYLPHHEVLRKNSRTTKLRVVFNGSSRSNDLSLNDILYAGAKLQADMCKIL
ncbi:hypothetical protein ACFW04_008665 [Cataglyphis niger]